MGSSDIVSNKALQNGLAASRGLSVKIVAYRGIVGNVSLQSRLVAQVPEPADQH
jgi:hypothetical protein